MATLKQVRDKADAKLVTFWRALQTRQEAYRAKHGKYFQLLVTGGRGVKNGEEYTFEVRHPSDERFAMDIDTNWTEQLPFEIQVNEWVGETVGYHVQVWVEWSGRLFSRERDSNQVDSGWYEVIEESII